MNYLDLSRQQTELFEGRITHLYLDTKGNVTTGVGFMLPNVSAALSLPFRAHIPFPQDGTGPAIAPSNAFLDGTRAANPAEIEADYNRVNSSTVGAAAEFYKSLTSVFLRNDDIDAQLLKVVTRNDAAMLNAFPSWPGWPISAKLACLDMIYNLGADKFLLGYNKLHAALVRKDWLGCAAECGRDNGDPKFVKRNQWTRQMFRNAFAVTGPTLQASALAPQG